LQGGGTGTVADLVDSEHPAVAKHYAHVGVVKAAKKAYGSFPEQLDQQYVMPSYKNQAFFTLSTKGYLASPTGYALTAPEEYFGRSSRSGSTGTSTTSARTRCAVGVSAGRRPAAPGSLSAGRQARQVDAIGERISIDESA
jgi:hypothetical protein